MRAAAAMNHCRVGTLLANMPSGVLVAGLDGRSYAVPRQQIATRVTLPGDVAVMCRDGVLRTYAGAPGGELLPEVLDAQLLSDAHQGRAITRADGRFYLDLQYREQAPQRALELAAAGVFDRGLGERHQLCENWHEAYCSERQRAGLSLLPMAPDADRHEGVLQCLGVLDSNGRRCAGIDTEAGYALIPTKDTWHYAGQPTAARRTADGHWTLIRLFGADQSWRERIAHTYAMHAAAALALAA